MASACILFGASAAQASTITVGSVLPPGFTREPFKEKQTFLNTALPEKGANLVSPVSGAIVRWRVQGAKGGPFFLRVLHPNGTGAYAASGTSGPATPTDPGLQTFTANLPVKAGDLIGIDPTNVTDEIGVAVDGPRRQLRVDIPVAQRRCDRAGPAVDFRQRARAQRRNPADCR